MHSVKPRLSNPKFDFSAVDINVAEGMSVQPDASDDTADLFAEEKPASVAAEPQTEETKTPEPKDPVAPSV